MVQYLAKNRKEALRIAKRRGYYVTEVSMLHERRGKKKLWTTKKKFR